MLITLSTVSDYNCYRQLNMYLMILQGDSGVEAPEGDGLQWTSVVDYPLEMLMTLSTVPDINSYCQLCMNLMILQGDSSVKASEGGEGARHQVVDRPL